MSHVDPSKSSSTSPPLVKVLNRLSAMGSLVTTKKDGSAMAQCPCHDDKKQSLSITTNAKGDVIMHDHAGCETPAIVSKMGMRMAELFVDGHEQRSVFVGSSGPKGTISKVYAYTDERGTLAYEAIRFEPKDFRQRRPDGKGGYLWNMHGATYYLYHLAEFLKRSKREAIFIVEGEKDVEALLARRQPATTNVGGAGKWRREYTEQLKKAGVKRVAILPDNDDPGRKHAEKVAAALHAVGIVVRIVHLPVVEKGDVSDYLATGHSVDELKALCAEAPVWEPSATPKPEASTTSPAVEGGLDVVEDHFTDVGFARMLAQSAQQRIRYCEARSCWYVYDGTRWAQGSGNLVKPFVHALAALFDEKAGAEKNEEARKRYRTQANRLETDRIIRGIINQAMALRDLQIDPTHFDRHRHLLNVLNGTIDLRTGVLQPHNPEDLIARIAPVEYHEGATSELWERTIELAMARDAEMVGFLQRVFGYALTGFTSEKKFFDAYGPKDTGKTTIHKAFLKMLGPDYAKALRAEALMHQREPDKIPHELADLMGVRFVVVSEVPDDRRLNEELMKNLSGGDVVRACFKYGNTFEFDPQLTLVLYSNDRIELVGSDDALWERATSIPFTFNFKTATEIPGYQHDSEVGLTLEQPAHQQGILAWAVRGAVAWHQQGLAPIPEKVERDTEAHRQEVNAVLAFLRERCEEGVGFKVAFQPLHRAYVKWAKEGHREKLTVDKFTEQMARLDHVVVTITSPSRHQVDGYVGIGLAPEERERAF